MKENPYCSAKLKIPHVFLVGHWALNCLQFNAFFFVTVNHISEDGHVS